MGGRKHEEQCAQTCGAVTWMYAWETDKVRRAGYPVW